MQARCAGRTVGLRGGVTGICRNSQRTPSLPACTQAGGHSPPPAPSPLTHLPRRTAEQAARGRRGCRHASSPEPMPAVCRGHPGTASGGEAPGAPAEPSCSRPGAEKGKAPCRGTAPASGLRLPRPKEGRERERYKHFQMRHTHTKSNPTTRGSGSGRTHFKHQSENSESARERPAGAARPRGDQSPLSTRAKGRWVNTGKQ